jgi:hypothetical protein
VVRFLVWIPLALWVGLSAAFIADVYIRGQPSSLEFVLDTVGSFTVYFYIAYFALWKMSRGLQPRRIVLAATLTLTPFLPLVALDLAGVEGSPIVHGMTVPNFLRWWEPGFWMKTAVQIATIHNPRLRPEYAAQPDWIAVRGGLRQPDGSLILYGISARARDSYIWESWKLLGRLDPAGDLDGNFVQSNLDSTVKSIVPQRDGSALALSSDSTGAIFKVFELSPDGGQKEIARFSHTGDSTDDDPHVKIILDSPVFPAKFLPAWSALVKVLPSGKQDDKFNVQAAETIRHQDLGNFRYAASDSQDTTLVAVDEGLLRLNSKGTLAPNGVTKFDLSGTGARAFVGPTGLAVAPDGSIFVTSGQEHEATMPPRLMRFNPDLKEDRVFSDAASTVAKPAGGDFHVLGFHDNDVVIVSFVQEKQPSRILFLDSKGRLLRQTVLKEPRSPQSTAPR